MKCIHCKKEIAAKSTKAGNEQLPRGWKRHQEGTVCPTCRDARFLLRAVTFPIASIIDADWPVFRKALNSSFEKATSLANWAVQELMKNDVVRDESMKKLPPMPPIYLYGMRDFKGWSQSASSILRAVEAKYRATRFDRIWRREVSLPNTKYPLPYPVHNKAWTASHGDDGQALVSLPLDGRRFTIRLRGGHEFRRQLNAFRKIVDGSAIQGELALYEVDASEGDHRPKTTRRRAGGGRKNHTRIMCKIVAWLPKEQRDPGENTMLVRTDKNAVLVAEVDGRQPWILNADHVRRWVAEHRVYLQRISEDTKHEMRYPADKRRQINEAREKRCHKQNNRLDSFCHETSTMLAKYAARCRVGQVIYDDSETSYFESFPWFKLKELIHQKLGALSIEVLGKKSDAQDPEGE